LTVLGVSTSSPSIFSSIYSILASIIISITMMSATNLHVCIFFYISFLDSQSRSPRALLCPLPYSKVELTFPLSMHSIGKQTQSIINFKGHHYFVCSVLSLGPENGECPLGWGWRLSLDCTICRCPEIHIVGSYWPLPPGDLSGARLLWSSW